MPERGFPLLLKGVVLRIEPGSLQVGQLLNATNVDAIKEFSVCPSPGSRRYIGSAGTWLTPHTLAKLTTGHGDAVDPRYVGEQNNIWRVTGPYILDTLVSSGLGLTLNRWESTPYNSGTSGTPYMFFATQARMLKDDSTWTPLRRWGIPPPTIPCGVASTGSGGQNGNYTYIYTFRNPTTGAEGNPCALAVSPTALSSQGATITYYGADQDPVTGDPALAGLGSIAIYRAGGTFGDNFYRFVGYGTNPGYSAGVPASGTFLDTIADIDLVNAATAEFDNDMPVTSSLPIPFVGTISSQTSANPPFTRVFLNNYPIYGAGLGLTWSITNQQGFFTPGTQVTIGTSSNQEVCTVFGVDPSNGVAPHWIDVFLQNSHSTGEQVSCDAIAGVPGDICCQYQDAILVAGDPNNPHIVYRSKSGRPDAFPVIDFEDGNAHQLNVGSPSNPVMGLVEYDGEVVCLNLKSINVFIVLDGAMSPPQETPSDRGMVAKHCWTRVKNEIWFLSYDGIYSWSGGQATLKTEAIRDVFNNYTTTIADQTYYQIDYTRLDAFHIECFEQEVWIDYLDVKSNYVCWRYQILYDRWLPRVFNSSVFGVFGAFLAEKDTGRMIAGIQDNSVFNPGTSMNGVGYLQQMNVGTSESWLVNENDGVQMSWGFTTGFESAMEKTRLCEYNELVIEILNDQMGPSDSVNFLLTYDFGPTFDPVDAFGVTALTAGGRRYISFPLQKSSIDGAATGKEAKSVSLTVSGKTINHVEIYSWTLRYNPREIPVRNSITDWQDLGTPNDKQLYCLSLEYDPRGQQIAMLLDTVVGILGSQVLAVQEFNLRPAIMTTLAANLTSGAPVMTLTDGTNVVIGSVLQIEKELVFCESAGGIPNIQRGYLGTTAAAHSAGTPVTSVGRVRQVFPIVDNVIAKLVRLRPVIPGQDFEIFKWQFEPIEKYPPDIVFFSELTDSGSPYLKFYNQIDLSVDTGGVDVTVNLELDGVNVFSFPINTDRFTRYQNITCPALLAGVNARILPQLPIPPNGKFQLWDVSYITTPADKGAVRHTTDWDDLGTQFDKQLQTITFEYDGSAGDVAMQIEELTGIHGDVPGPGMTVQLVGGSRAKQQFPFPDGHIAKMVRVHPVGNPPLAYKSWTYSIGKIDFPPDFILFTDLTDNQSPYLKYINQIVLEVDTGGQDVFVLLECDGIIKWQFTVNSTRLTRRQAFTCPPQISGTNLRILIKYPTCLGTGA